MRIQFTFLGLGLLLVLPMFVWAQDRTSSKAVDELFSEWSNTNSPGCAVAVIKDGQIIHKSGYGMADLEHDVPIRPSSVFYIGSVSKQFVAACMLLLDEQGKIDLDADVRTYIPEFPDYGYKITIRNLIHHTSGVRDNLTLWELAGRSHLEEIPEEEIFDMICRQKELNFEPGTRYMYSNSCYFLMSIIVERVSGLSLREYAEKHIFQPLGMDHSIFGDNNRRIIRNRAFAYGKNADGSFNSMLMRFDLVGSGGLYSTVEDLFLWDQNLYNNTIGKRGQAFIDDMLTNGKYKDGSAVDYAFALVNGTYKGLRTISHSGALGGYRAFFIQFPEQQFSIIILSNLEVFQPQQLAEKVADIYLADQLQVGQKQEKKKQAPPKIIQLSEKHLAAVQGQYWNPDVGFPLKVYLKADTLRFYDEEWGERILSPIGMRQFLLSGMDNEVMVRFYPANKERPRQLALAFNGKEVVRAEHFEAQDPSAKTMSELTGSYYSPELDTRYQIKLEDKQLLLKLKNQGWKAMKRIKKDLYTQASIGQFNFSFTDKGEVVGFSLDAGRVKNLKFSKME
ncbi:MAG: beta-lactamase family protein [Saprospiraceae bacterium]|nr:beta-lactamase family protein [Saprospiraceae bacterium]